MLDKKIKDFEDKLEVFMRIAGEISKEYEQYKKDREFRDSLDQAAKTHEKLPEHRKNVLRNSMRGYVDPPRKIKE